MAQLAPSFVICSQIRRRTVCGGREKCQNKTSRTYSRLLCCSLPCAVISELSPAKSPLKTATGVRSAGRTGLLTRGFMFAVILVQWSVRRSLSCWNTRDCCSDASFYFYLRPDFNGNQRAHFSVNLCHMLVKLSFYNVCFTSWKYERFFPTVTGLQSTGLRHKWKHLEWISLKCNPAYVRSAAAGRLLYGFMHIVE